MHKTDNLWDDL